MRLRAAVAGLLSLTGLAFAAGTAHADTTVPVLSGGKAAAVSPTRENVSFHQSAASADKFTIVGPGKINGHVGWVNAVVGVNTAAYTGLEAGHGYTVTYQPYTSQGGTPVVGSVAGQVYFRTAARSIAGEYCSSSQHSTTETVDGITYRCEDVDGWRWEPLSAQ